MAIRAYSLAIDVFKVVLSDYVVDYTRLNIDQRVLMEKETDGYDFHYVYGLDKVNVKVTGEGTDWWGQNVKKCVYSDYVHTNRLGSVVNMSDQYGRVPARVDYSDWGEVTAYDSITVDGGFRVLLPEITYATHQYDDILDQFYAKARMYDASGKRFTAVDPILDPSGYDISSYVKEPMMLVQYLYVKDNAVNWIDPDGEFGLFAGTVLATAASALIAGATSAYQSYKADGKVNWSQAGKAAVGGALTAVSVGVAVVTGGTAAGIGVMAAGAIIGTKTALHGGSAADVASSMGKASATALVGGKLLSSASTTTKFIVGTVGTAAGGVKTTKDVKTAVNTVKDENASAQQKVAAVFDVGVSAAATMGSAAYAAKNVPESIARPITSYLEKLQCGKTLGNKVTTIGESLKFGSDVKSAQKLSNQMSRRGWTQDLVVKTVDQPFTTRVSINKATGNSATVYYTQRGAYVVVDDVTNEVVQVSDNINPATWAPDREIIDPYTPN